MEQSYRTYDFGTCQLVYLGEGINTSPGYVWERLPRLTRNEVIFSPSLTGKETALLCPYIEEGCSNFGLFPRSYASLLDYPEKIPYTVFEPSILLGECRLGLFRT